MNVFEYAMKMETDGRQFYLEQAKNVGSPELERVLLELADDELKHFNIFKALRDGQKIVFKENEQTKILLTVKNIFETMKASKKDYSFHKEAKRIWEEAREVEKQAENFYRQKAGEVTNDNEKKILNQIADEEHRHWVTMENVIQFLDRPKTWLEDAEWSHLEEY